MKKSIIMLFIMLFIMLTLTGFITKICVAEDIKLIANNSKNETSISKMDLYKILKGAKLYWENELPVKFAYIYNKNKEFIEIESNFMKKHAKMNIFQMERYWNRLKFSGYTSAPYIFDTPEKVMDFVANNEGAIGIVPDSLNIKNVKVLTIE